MDDTKRGALEAGTSAQWADEAARDAPGDAQPGEDAELRREKLLDEAVEETFPASDPISPA
jgi:hypothetical protein